MKTINSKYYILNLRVLICRITGITCWSRVNINCCQLDIRNKTAHSITNIIRYCSLSKIPTSKRLSLLNLIPPVLLKIQSKKKYQSNVTYMWCITLNTDALRFSSILTSQCIPQSSLTHILNKIPTYRPFAYK